MNNPKECKITKEYKIQFNSKILFLKTHFKLLWCKIYWHAAILNNFAKKNRKKDYGLQEVEVDTFYGNFGKIGVNAGWSNIPLHGMMGEGEWLDHESLAFALLDKEIKGG